MTKPLPPELRKTKRVGELVDWNDRRVDMLCEMWATGQYSASQIAERLGLVRGRNAVIGKIHRLGLGRRTAAQIHATLRANALAVAEKRRDRAARQLVKTEQALAKASLTAAERREKFAAQGRATIAKIELTLIENPAFVKAEKPFDPYSHLRSDKGYLDAIAALSRGS
jgi:hypothetical protein